MNSCIISSSSSTRRGDIPHVYMAVYGCCVLGGKRIRVHSSHKKAWTDNLRRMYIGYSIHVYTFHWLCSYIACRDTVAVLSSNKAAINTHVPPRKEYTILMFYARV